MSALNHKPASALPWRYVEKPIDKNNVPRVLADDGGVAILCVNRMMGDPGPSRNELANAVYIVHAANAYPKLVEALRNVAPMATARGKAGQQIIADAKALLRELGEAS